MFVFKVSTDTDDGLLLISNASCGYREDQADSPVVTPGKVSSDSPRLNFIKPTLPDSDRVSLRDDERRKPEANLSRAEAVSEDSGFEPSPKVSESGSELVGTPLKQTHPVFFGEFDQETPEGTPLSLPSLLFTPSDVGHDLAALDNEVFDPDLTRGSTLNKQCDKLWDLDTKRVSRTGSIVEISGRAFCSENVNMPRCHSNPDLGTVNIETQNKTSTLPEKKNLPTSFTTSIECSHDTIQPVRKERRKAVVKPPTLALDNKTYLTIGTSLRQLPPPIQILRRSRALAVSGDVDHSRRSSDTSGDSSRKESQSSFYSSSLPKQNRKVEGVYHRVLAQVHQPQNSSLNQESITRTNSRHQTTPSVVNSMTSFDPVPDIPSSIPVTVVERGKRRFIRPQDISILKNDTDFHGSNILNGSSSFSHPAQHQNCSEFSKISEELLKKKSSQPLSELSLCPHITVSPVRYVHFQFPSVSHSNSNHKRSLSEDNILACAAHAEEFPGFPKTMRNLTLMNETPKELPDSALSLSSATSSARMRAQAVGLTGYDYIPVRRYSDPSSLPVSFIRRTSQTSSPNSTGSSESTGESSISCGPAMAQIYIQGGSPSGLRGMHFRWPRMPWEKKGVSWAGCDGVDAAPSGVDASSGETQRSGGRKIFVKEKHPYALFQV
ncbi:hypothetical protein EGW08_006565 [Elysia chlorotica]|uniref:Uncharacterized protein n=1 Tax=Elysia chlorotica TaxID=188477 RepID=A0A3S1BK62_ELYCH|nr:hypothetical protein EGW08_006565 [Elysia chlorotica]